MVALFLNSLDKQYKVFVVLFGSQYYIFHLLKLKLKFRSDLLRTETTVIILEIKEFLREKKKEGTTLMYSIKKSEIM